MKTVEFKAKTADSNVDSNVGSFRKKIAIRLIQNEKYLYKIIIQLNCEHHNSLEHILNFTQTKQQMNPLCK